MILLHDKKVTANEAAKYLVADKGETADYWNEFSCIDVKKLTAKEEEAINDAVSKHQERVRRFLGMSKIHTKIWGE